MKQQSLSRRLLAMVLALILLATQFGLTAVFAAPKDNDVHDPVFTGYQSTKFDPPPTPDGAHVTRNIPGYGDITVWIVTENGEEVVHFTATFGISYLFVKGGPGGNLYTYTDPVESGTGISPDNSSGHAAAVSHITFYFKQPTYGRISITKSLVPPVAGDDTSFSITVQQVGVPANTHTVSLTAGMTTTVDHLPFGSYQVTEAAADGYSLVSISPETFTLTEANSVVPLAITVTNEKDPVGSLTVYKQLSDEAPAEAGVLFPVVVTLPGGGTLTKQIEAGGYVVFPDLPMGEYLVTEGTVPPGYAFVSIAQGSDPASATNSLTVTIRKDALHPEVTLTNERLQIPELPSIRIQKAVLDGPSDPDLAFSMKVERTPSSDDPFSHSFALKEGQTEVLDDVLPGVYTITEQDIPDGYSLDGISIDGVPQGTATPVSFTVPEDSSRQIVIVVTNRKLPPPVGTLVVAKVLENAPAEDETLFTVHVRYDGEDIAGSPFQLKGGDSRTFSALPPGEYVVEEDTPDNTSYHLVSIRQGDSDLEEGLVEVKANTSATVTVTNRKDNPPDPKGAVRIQKRMQDGSTPSQAFTVVLTKTGESGTIIRKVDVTPGADPILVSDLEPGLYAVSEESVAGYETVSFDPATVMVTGQTEATTVAILPLVVVTNRVIPSNPPSSPPSTPPSSSPPETPPSSPPETPPSTPPETPPSSPPESPVVTLTTPDVVPGNAPDVVTEEISTPEEVPLSAPALPKTSGFPLAALLAAGAATLTAGWRIRGKRPD